jgi:hypothetical protein
MTVSEHRSFRLLAAVFCSIGILGVVDGAPLTWTILTLAAFSSAVLLPTLLAGPRLVPATCSPTPGENR